MGEHFLYEVVAPLSSLYPKVLYLLSLAPDAERTEHLAESERGFPPFLHYDIARLLDCEEIPAYLHESVIIGRPEVFCFFIFRERFPYLEKVCFCHTVN